jgi:hypothetical protein
MASYSELCDLTSDPALLKRVMTAVAVAAETIRAEDPATANHQSRVAWAKLALRNVDGAARGLMWILAAQNKALDVTQIQGATDVAIQNAVDSAIELLL